MIVLFPVLLVILAILTVALLAGKAGCKYNTVRAFTFPASLIFSNVIAVPVFLAGTFCFSMITGHRSVFVHYFIHVADFSLCVLWGPLLSTVFDLGAQDFAPQVKISEIIIYQIVIFLTVGHRVLRHFSISIMDIVTIKAAEKDQIQPYMLRKRRKTSDPGYAEASLFYDSRCSAPLLGVLAAAALGIDPELFYSD